MPLSLALAIDITPSLRSELRWELAGVAIGFVLLWIGLAAMAVLREEFGKSRLKKFLSASSSSTAHLADSLLLELRRWSGADAGRTQDDDITVLVLDFHPSP